MKIKVNNKHDGNIKMFVCKSNDGKPFTSLECERIYNALCDGNAESLYHQCNLQRGYRIRVFELDDFCYLTMALTNENGDDDVTIQEYEKSLKNDAIATAKFFVKNYVNLVRAGVESSKPIDEDDLDA